MNFKEMNIKAREAVYAARAMSFEQMCAWYKENVGSDPREDGAEYTPSESKLRHDVSCHIFWNSLPEGMDQKTSNGKHRAENFLDIVEHE